MSRFITRWVISAVALYAAVAILPGIELQNENWLSIIWLALIFGLVNALVRPLLHMLTCPLIVLTLGLFVLVANTAFNFLTFAPVYIITKGGPRGSTNLLMYESYKSAFVNLDMGRASAITTILLGIILIFSLFEFKWTKAGFEY